MKKDNNIIIRISTEDKEALKQISENIGVPVSELITEQIKNLIKRFGSEKDVDITHTLGYVLNTIKNFNETNGYNDETVPNSWDKKMYGVIEFSPSNFKEQYPVAARTFWFSSDNNYLYKGNTRTSLIGHCFDKSINPIRLDAYINDWLISDIYVAYPSVVNGKNVLVDENDNILCEVN